MRNRTKIHISVNINIQPLRLMIYGVSEVENGILTKCDRKIPILSREQSKNLKIVTFLFSPIGYDIAFEVDYI